MAIKRLKSTINVVEAAKIRVKNIFKNGLPVYFSFSGGKDSLALAQVVLSLAQGGEIDMHQLTVQFIDEEAIFPCVEEMVKKWRRIFMMNGARFDWLCLEVRHFNCFNQLENDESFICWDKQKEDTWIRKPPAFAIRTHPKLKPRRDTYQIFLERANTDGISIVGVRMSESVQRLQYIASMTRSGRTITRQLKAFPIYDWTNNDVWLYLRMEHVDIPVIYLYLWQAGTRKNQLRVSQFFSVDTARSLVRMNEYYPNLMDRIILREPNAYLAALYWDSDMFGRSSQDRKELEKGQEKKDYKTELTKLFTNFDSVFDTPHKRFVGTQYKRFFLKVSNIATEEDFRAIYESLMAGDPKLRNQRALYMKIFGKYVKNAKEKEAELYG